MIKVNEALEKIKPMIGDPPKLGIILGSGMGKLVDDFKDPVTIKFQDIPNFPKSNVKGHRGDVVVGTFSGIKVIAFSGRLHYYEGYSMEEICLPVNIMHGLGVKRLIVTNAGGAVNKEFSTGDIVIIKDHINMLGENPLRGTWEFIDMTDAYSSLLRVVAHDTAAQLELDIKEGVYLAMSGPTYETPAEINMARVMGADIVGMSTVPEVTIANSLNIEVLGLSMITNMAAGILNQKLSHSEVIEVTERAGDRFSVLIEKIILNISQMKEEE
ncbi:MAG: purine-nucleoside phosphorylase [Elusimicrobiota bacterium]